MRLFIGIRLPEPIKAALGEVASRLAQRYPARYVPPPNYHLTLAYLGERDEASLPGLRQLLSRAAAGTVAFPLTLQGIGFFGQPGDAILYAALSDSPPLLALNERLRESLHLAGETFDPKPLTPHVTLARRARLPENAQEQTTAEPPNALPFPAMGVTLFHSTRAEGVLCYLPLFEAPFVLQNKEELP